MIKRLLVTLGVLLPVIYSVQALAQELCAFTGAAEKLSVKNIPQLTAAVLNAAASLQVPAEFRAAYLPTLQGNATGVVADKGSRLAAGGLNNPAAYV